MGAEKLKIHYENCQLLAPDRMLLCMCDRKKINWYVKHGLGELVSENPTVAKLKFVPSGYSKDDDDYNKQPRENICVVCGKKENLFKKYVVPHDLRKHFPEAMKSHQSHDRLLLCKGCLLKCDQKDERFFKILWNEYGKNSKVEVKKVNHEELRKLQYILSQVTALVKHENHIPANRVHEKLATISRYFQVESSSLTRDQLMGFILPLKERSRVQSRPTFDRSKEIVKIFKNNEALGLHKLEILCREHFVLSTGAKFLPTMWSTHHHHEGKGT